MISRKIEILIIIFERDFLKNDSKYMGQILFAHYSDPFGGNRVSDVSRISSRNLNSLCAILIKLSKFKIMMGKIMIFYTPYHLYC